MWVTFLQSEEGLGLSYDGPCRSGGKGKLARALEPLTLWLIPCHPFTCPLYVSGLISRSICLPPWMTLFNICWMKEGIPLQSYNCLEAEDDASSLLFKQPRWGVAMATWDHKVVASGMIRVSSEKQQACPHSLPHGSPCRVDVVTALSR